MCVSLSELWNDEVSGRKKRRDALSPDKKRRRPSVVSDILPSLILLLPFTLIPQSTITTSLNPVSGCVLIFTFECFHAPRGTSLTRLTPIYCLYAARLGHPGGLDSYQKGVQMSSPVLALFPTANNNNSLLHIGTFILC